MKVDEALLAEWRRRPADTFRLIVRVSGELAEAEARLIKAGIQMRRRFKLINGLVIECTGAQAASLLNESWLLSGELDQPVQAWTTGR
jgi:hypothetical protein